MRLTGVERKRFLSCLKDHVGLRVVYGKGLGNFAWCQVHARASASRMPNYLQSEARAILRFNIEHGCKEEASEAHKALAYLVRGGR